MVEAKSLLPGTLSELIKLGGKYGNEEDLERFKKTEKKVKEGKLA